MSSLQLTWKLFRNNLRSTASYLGALLLSVGIYYDFALLKYHSGVLGTFGNSTTMIVCATLMSVVMLIVFFAFVWTSSRFFLEQRKKEIGLYALCGVPMGRAARIFLFDGLLTGGIALGGGLALGVLLTKLFLMGAAQVIRLEVPMTFALPIPALVETTIVVAVIFLACSVRNMLIVRRSDLITLLQGMRRSEKPPRRRIVRAVLAVLALGGGYALSLTGIQLIVLTCIPILLLVIIGSYWAFEALLPAILERLTRAKGFFYRGMRMVGISNLWYRLRTNYRNLALTSVLSATAIATLCTALTMSDFAGAREGKYSMRLFRAYNMTAWMPAADRAGVEAAMERTGIDAGDAIWIPMARVTQGGYPAMLIEKTDADATAAVVARLANMPRPDYAMGEYDAVRVKSPDRGAIISMEAENKVIRVGDRELRTLFMEDAWLWGGNTYISEAYIVPDGFIASLSGGYEERLFLGVQAPDEQVEQLLGVLGDRWPNVTAEANRSLTTQGRVLYGTLSYLGLILFAVFSLLTACALFFKQLSEAHADRLKYQSMKHIGATRGEMARAVAVQVGLSLLVPILLGFVHAAFAVRVMSEVFALPTMRYLLMSVGTYACVVAVLFGVTIRRFMQVVAD